MITENNLQLKLRMTFSAQIYDADSFVDFQGSGFEDMFRSILTVFLFFLFVFLMLMPRNLQGEPGFPGVPGRKVKAWFGVVVSLTHFSDHS